MGGYPQVRTQLLAAAYGAAPVDHDSGARMPYKPGLTSRVELTIYRALERERAVRPVASAYVHTAFMPRFERVIHWCEGVTGERERAP
ncbi:hypothetical protein GCM10027160_26490 [Streptomyces calidiresistens]